MKGTCFDRRRCAGSWVIATMGVLAACDGDSVTRLYDAGPNYPPALELEKAAWNDYRSGNPAESLAKLDEAKTLFPGIESRPDTKWLRRNAALALLSEAGASEARESAAPGEPSDASAPATPTGDP